MGMTDEPVSVDRSTPPFGKTHILLTSYPGRALPSKTAHVVGIANQRFRLVWSYMLTVGE
jgi:hypothetical protein